MKFLCDVHIARKVAYFLDRKCELAIHANDVLSGSATKDAALAQFADEGDLILISKDADFLNSHLIHRVPKKLIKINLGNIPTGDLMRLLERHFEHIRIQNAKNFFLIEIFPETIRVY